MRDSLEQAYFSQQKDIEAKACQMAPAEAQQFLNDYSIQQAQQMLARWKQLAFYLIVKYNDMAVRPEKDGKFARSEHGLGAHVKRPGFPITYARKLLKETGDKYLIPE